MTDGLTDGPTYGRTDQRTDRPMEGPTDILTDLPSCRDASPHFIVANFQTTGVEIRGPSKNPITLNFTEKKSLKWNWNERRKNGRRERISKDEQKETAPHFGRNLLP